jgi:hypothetical protein
VVSGVWVLEHVFELIDTVAAETMRRQRNRVLVDIRAVSGTPTDMDRYRWAVRASEVIGGRIRAAVLGRTNQLNKFGENTAVNRGGDVLIETDPQAAMDWLLRKPGE